MRPIGREAAEGRWTEVLDLNINAFLDRFDSVIEEPDGWVVTCPAHADSHESLRVSVGNTNKIILKCRAGCETRSVLDALKLTFADLSDAGENVTVRATSTDNPPPADEIARMAERLDEHAEALFSEAGTPAREYAEQRFGVDGDRARLLGLGFADNLGGGPRLVVPFRDKVGTALGYQARALDSSAQVRWLGPKSPDGSSWAKVAWFPGGTDYDPIIVTEGPGDALTSCAVGYDSIGIRGAGLAVSGTVADAVVALTGTHRPVIIFGDDDTAGEAFAKSLRSALAVRGVDVIFDTKPPAANDVTAWREADPAGFAEAFQSHVNALLADPAPSDVESMLAQFEVDLGDIYMADLLRSAIREAGSDVRFTSEVGFLILDGGVWVPDSLDSVRTYAHSVAYGLDRLLRNAKQILATRAATPQELTLVERAQRVVKRAGMSTTIDHVVRECQALPGVAADINDFDGDPDVLAVRNGVINLRDGSLRPHDASLHLTRKIDVNYDPDAACPRWDQFLAEVFPEYPDLPAFIQRLVGYGITGHTTEQCFVVHYGKGSNGKSVFTDTLTEVFRAITVTTPFSTFESRPAGGIPNDIAALKGARLVMASEGEAGRPMAESVLKRVTGNDLISARFMRKEFFEFRPSFLIQLSTNHKPQFKGQDEGLWRRVKLIPWERYFAPNERDGYLGEKLLAEAPGILAWAVRGAVEWYSTRLNEPEVIKAETLEYRVTSDALAGFLPGWYEADPNADPVLGSEVFKDYEDWADEERLPRAERWQRKTFYAALEDRGFPRRKVSKGVVVLGIRKVERAAAPFEAHKGTGKVPSLEDDA